MSTYSLILERRSIRRFLQQSIPLSTLQRMVNAARLAPSGANLQPLEYVVVDNSEQVERVFGTLKWAGYIRPAGNPPQGEHPAAYIVVLDNVSIKPTGYNQDVGAAMENMILTAMDEGLGSCWHTSFDKPALEKVLSLENHLTAVAVLALGYPNEEPAVVELDDPEGSIKYWKDESGRLHVPKRRLEDVIHHNQYNEACPISYENEDWEVIMETSIEEEAYLVQGFLQSNGIPCVMEDLKFHANPVNFGAMSNVRLLVPEDKLREGQRLLAEMENFVDDVDQGDDD